jgi:hypothetical protein
MSTLTKLLIVPAIVVAFGAGVAIAASGGGDDLSSPVSATGSTAETTTGVLDVSGPCDEAEHASDPRCTGVPLAGGAAPAAGIDVSGPCDEAEHANDPRCTGAAGLRDDDNSGPGSHFEDDDDNSGPGSSHSGRGSDDDHDDDDDRGHGSGDRHGGEDR